MTGWKSGVMELYWHGMWKRFFRKSQPEKAPPTPEPTAPELLTLKERVTAFWEWYVSVADRFYAEIESKRCGELEPEVSAKVNELLGGMAWVFGPGENQQGHSFTLTPEGDRHRRLVAQYWLAQAPEIPGWTFYASRQPSELHRSGHSIRIEDMSFGAHEIWLTPSVDAEAESVDLTVWHPLFDRIDNGLRWTVVFLWLDEALGEDAVSQRVGEIKLGDGKLADSIPLSELPEYIAELEAERGWKRMPPHQSCSSYHRKEPERGGGLRQDIIAGSTLQMNIVQEYPMDANPLADFGAEYEMIIIPISQLPPGQQVDARGQLEEVLEAALSKSGTGKVLGGATGLENAYIDVVLFDAVRSRHVIKSVMAATQYAEHYRTAGFVQASASP
jgi:hypothetical protein